MKTIILSGGLGYRLKEETEFKPKPMVAIGGKPILWHIMKIYSHYGYNDFILALGYKGDYIKEYFLNQKFFANNFTLNTKNGATKILRRSKTHPIEDFTITFVDTGAETLPGERILRLQNYIPKTDKNFMVTYGDGVSDINIKKLVAFHIRQKTIGTLTGVKPTSKYGILTVGNKDVVTGFNEKPEMDQLVNGGFMVFKREFFKYLSENEMEHEAIKRLIKKRELSLFKHDGFWHAMDTYPDVENLNKLWKESARWKVWKD